jgi:hypothetical protein
MVLANRSHERRWKMYPMPTIVSACYPPLVPQNEGKQSPINYALHNTLPCTFACCTLPTRYSGRVASLTHCLPDYHGLCLNIFWLQIYKYDKITSWNCLHAYYLSTPCCSCAQTVAQYQPCALMKLPARILCILYKHTLLLLCTDCRTTLAFSHISAHHTTLDRTPYRTIPHTKPY